MKHLDQVSHILQVLGWFPAHCVRCVIEALLFYEVEQAPILSSAVHLAIQDPIDLPFT